jgi:hypothetical protein
MFFQYANKFAELVHVLIYRKNVTDAVAPQIYFKIIFVRY